MQMFLVILLEFFITIKKNFLTFKFDQTIFSFTNK